MSYTNPLTKNPLEGYTPVEILDIWERNTNQVIEMIEPKVLRGWTDTVVKANFILAYSVLNSFTANDAK